MRKLTLVIALLLVPTQVFAGSLYDYNTRTRLQAHDRRVQTSTAASKLTNVFSGGNRIGVYTLENNYHEARYIRAQNDKLAIYQKLERARLVQKENELKQREKELQLLERRLVFQMRDERRLQDLRAQTYNQLPESQTINVGSRSSNTEVRTASSKSGGPAGNWVRKVLFDWNS